MVSKAAAPVAHEHNTWKVVRKNVNSIQIDAMENCAVLGSALHKWRDIFPRVCFHSSTSFRSRAEAAVAATAVFSIFHFFLFSFVSAHFSFFPFRWGGPASPARFSANVYVLITTTEESWRAS